MKILGNEIKPGMIIEHKDDLWSVLKAQHVKPGKGGAFNQVELKSVKKGTKLNERFRSSDTVERAILDDKKFSFLYEDETNCHFMDQVSFEQIQINKIILGEKTKLLKEKREVQIRIALIQKRINSIWKKPSLINKNIQAEFVINLAPSGEILSFDLISSSGEKVFDDSALAALSKIYFITEVIGLERKYFERNFRSFNLVFKSKNQ